MSKIFSGLLSLVLSFWLGTSIAYAITPPPLTIHEYKIVSVTPIKLHLVQGGICQTRMRHVLVVGDQIIEQPRIFVEIKPGAPLKLQGFGTSLVVFNCRGGKIWISAEQLPPSPVGQLPPPPPPPLLP